jgi:hypothetical protein
MYGEHHNNSILRSIPLPGCKPAASDPFVSVSRVERLRKLPAEIASIPASVKLYSLVAVTDKEKCASLLRPYYSILAGDDPRNDGQVLYYDAVLPGSRLLGYANSDHWAIALAFNRSKHPFWRNYVDHNAYPREILLEAILLQVQAGMGAEGSQRM